MIKIRFNRIFWKMFSVIWLANSVIILLMSYVLLHHQAISQMTAHHQQQVQSLAQIIIQRYEADKPMPKANWERWPQLQRRFELPPLFFMELRDDEGTLIYRLPKGKKQRGNLSTLLLLAESGKEYRVSYSVKPLPRFLIGVVKKMLSLQLFLLLFTAALVSGVLSWQLVRPIKALAAIGRSYRVGESKVNPLLGSRLIKRGDELGDLARALDVMFQKNDATFKAQQHLLHDVSHELRAPLARLQVAASLVERETANNSNVQKIHKQCDRLNALIQQILTFARTEEAEVQVVAVDINSVITRVVDDVRFEFPTRIINWQPLKPEAQMQGEPELLMRAIENILRNACKHTSPATLIDVLLEPAQMIGFRWCLRIRDYGEGIIETEAESLLKPFYRSGQQMHTEGFGLGLSIAARAIAKQKGTLTLSNHPEGGLLALIYLP